MHGSAYEKITKRSIERSIQRVTKRDDIAVYLKLKLKILLEF